MIKQHLPTYKHEFEDYPEWIKKESEHYIFYYTKDSETEKDIEYVVKTQEEAYKKIISVLGVAEPDKNIEYYFYPNEKLKAQLMGDGWYAQTIYAEFRIHVLYTDTIKPIGPHEDTHLLSLPLGLSIGFFQEGLAEYMVGSAWDGKGHNKYVKDGYENNLFPSLETFMTHNGWMNTSDNNTIYFYSLAGAFVTYLINTYGMDAFKEFYKESNREKTQDQNSEIFQKIFKYPIKESEDKFIENINKNP